MTVAGGPSLSKPRRQPWASPAASCCRLPAWSQLLSSFAATRTTTSEGEGGEAEGCNPCTTTTSAVAETARLCGGAPIEEAILAIRLQPRDAAGTRTTTSEDEAGEAEGCNPCTTTTSEVAETARLCGGAPIEEALLAIRLQPRDAAGGADRALAGLGFKSALDLQLMQAGGPEVQSSRWL